MSLRNPKHKFSASITFEKHVEGIGQSVTITADTLQELQALAKEYRKFNSHVLIKENKAEYPKFNWVEVKEYNLSEPEKEHREKIGSIYASSSMRNIVRHRAEALRIYCSKTSHTLGRMRKFP